MKKTTIVHLIIIGLIVVIAGVSAYKLYAWNKGSGTDREASIEQVDPSTFDVEVLDMIIPMDSSRMAGHEDDGELQILCLGNNPFTDDRSENGLANLIAKKTGATVYDAAFPDSSTAYRNYPISPNFPWDHYNLPSIANVLLAGDFKTINSASQYVEDLSLYTPGIEALEAVDMNKLDAIVLMYDSTDYNVGTPCFNEAVPDDVTAFTGGLTFFLNIVNQYWPHIRVFVMTPTFAQYKDQDGKLYSGSIKDIGNGSLPFYVQNEIDATVSCGYSVIDNFYGTINESNYQEYLSDHMHLNDAGREKVADRIADIINNKMSTVNSTGN